MLSNINNKIKKSHSRAFLTLKFTKKKSMEEISIINE